MENEGTKEEIVIEVGAENKKYLKWLKEKEGITEYVKELIEKDK